MNQSQKLLLQSLSAFLHGKTVTPPTDEAVLKRTFDMARIHFVLPMVYEAMGDCLEPSGAAAAAKRISTNAVVNQAMKTKSFLELYDVFNQHGIKALVIKGLICRNIYPKIDYRASNDEDIFIMPKDFSNARKILSDRGFVQADSTIAPNQLECAYYKPPGFVVELHRNLFDSDSPDFKNTNDIFSASFDNAIQVEIMGVKVWTMNYTDHMLYLIMHSLKHFMGSGAGIRQICDINLYATTYADKIDWQKVFTVLKSHRADVFAMNAFEIGRVHLGYDIQCLKKYFDEYAADIHCEELVEDILSSGISGGSDGASGHSRKNSDNHWVFPRPSALRKQYPYAQKRPFLLPVAWAQNLGKHISAKSSNDHGSDDHTASRRELMKKYKIID